VIRHQTSDAESQTGMVMPCCKDSGMPEHVDETGYTPENT